MKDFIVIILLLLIADFGLLLSIFMSLGEKCQHTEKQRQQQDHDGPTHKPKGQKPIPLLARLPWTRQHQVVSCDSHATSGNWVVTCLQLHGDVIPERSMFLAKQAQTNLGTRLTHDVRWKRTI